MNFWRLAEHAVMFAVGFCAAYNIMWTDDPALGLVIGIGAGIISIFWSNLDQR